jgi:hypothetical protein
MSPIHVRHLNFRYEHPPKDEPSWKGVVERWYQLDPFAYGLTQAYSVWKSEIPSPPAMILLASPRASNETDFQFAHGGAVSPAKFVHTLPNIRCSPLCQVMEWSGPVLCLQKDPFTTLHALREAAAFLEAGAAAPIWVLTVFRQDGLEIAARLYEAQAFVLTHESHDSEQASLAIMRTSHRDTLQTDRELQVWLNSGSGEDPLPLPGGFELRRNV